MRADHERLLDVGRLGRAGNEDAEASHIEIQPIVGLVHVVDDLVAGHDQRQVLG